MTRFSRDTAASPLGDGAYEVQLDTAWWVVRGPNGGYVAACLVNAMRGEVDAGRALRSLTVHYTAVPAEGEARVQVRVERSGRSMTSVSARMTQGDRLLALALAAFSGPFSGGDEALTGGWIALTEEQALDEPLLVALTDSWVPAPFGVVDRPVLAPTIDLTVHVRAPLPRAHDSVFLEAVSATARDGFFEEDVRIWGRDGTLLVQSRQLALLL